MNNKAFLLMVLPAGILLVFYAPAMYHIFIDNEPIYGEWSEWSNCMNSCGPSWQGRNRNCSTVSSIFGKPCIYKEKFQTRPCSQMECPIDGRPGEWSEWQPCEIECKDSTRERVRYCNDPAPQHNGLNCFESMNEVEACPSDEMCPIDGYYKTDADWGECSVTCGGGVKQKPHPCEPPKYGGKPCNSDEPKEETSTCNENACPTTTTTTTTTTKAPTKKPETTIPKEPPAN